MVASDPLNSNQIVELVVQLVFFVLLNFISMCNFLFEVVSLLLCTYFAPDVGDSVDVLFSTATYVFFQKWNDGMLNYVAC